MLVTEITAFICATSLCRGALLKLDLLATWGKHKAAGLSYSVYTQMQQHHAIQMFMFYANRI